MDRLKGEAPRIAVVGAGIVGVSCALHLQRLGASVVMVDRGEPGHDDGAWLCQSKIA